MFIQFDICTYYASITENTLNKALHLASSIIKIEQMELDIINKCRTTLLVRDNEHWTRKGNNANFDVGMGSYDSAQVADLVGLLILHSIDKIAELNKSDFGLYRDDGLIAVPNATGPKINRIRKKLTSILLDLGFKLDIESNKHLKIVNYLDVTLNLSNNTYQNYSKPNTTVFPR